MLRRIRTTLFKPASVPIRMHFSLDRADVAHRIRIEKEVAGQRQLVDDITPLAAYGYRETLLVSGKPETYTLTENDLQTLFALKSMNPIVEDGVHVFPFAPPILDYLRKKENVAESDSSAALHVSQTPLKPSARIAFDPQQGLLVDAGYALSDQGELVPLEALPQTKDGAFAVIGDAFRPIEQSASRAAQAWLNKGKSVVIPSDIPEFFQRDLVLLRNEFSAVLTDLATTLRVIDEPITPIVQVQKSSGGWLDFNVAYQAGNAVIPPGLLSTSITNNEYVQVGDTTWIRIDPKTLAKTQKELDRLEAEVTLTGYRVPVSQFASLEDFIEELGGQRELNLAYQTFLQQLAGFQPDERHRLSPAAEARLQTEGITLRPYQRSGIHWINWLYTNHLHGILADDMGLGKTLQTIMQLRQAYESSDTRAHSLIIAPRSVLSHWEREIQRFYPEANVYRYHGPAREQRYLKAATPMIFISTYATATNDIELLQNVPLLYLVLDEATAIKNPSSQRTQAVKALNSAHRICLSGTPVENRPTELWSLFDFLMRGHLGKYGTFARMYENPITSGDYAASERLGKRIRPFMLRRMKQEVARDLPEKIELDEWCELSPEQAALYGGLQDEVKRIYTALSAGEQVNYTSSILPVLTKLKQICNHPAIVTGDRNGIMGRSNKFDWIAKKVEAIVQQDDQVVIFSHFLGMLDLFEQVLQKKGWGFVRIDGSTRHRQVLIDRFNQRQAPIALCSIRATGYGINMTAANHVIHADRWWNPAVEDQATDRVHRIGQDKTVYVYRILVENTLEERIDELLANKRKMAGQIMGAAKQGGHSWTREELLALLRPIDK